VHVRLDVLWDCEAEAGAGDTHLAVFRGSQARVEVRQGKEENYRPELFVVPNEVSDRAAVGKALERKVASWQKEFPGVGVGSQEGRFWVTIPATYREGHEAHFGQVARQFLHYLAEPASLPAWERPNMMAKYTVTTQGVRLAQQRG
jgi:hypothetical protein